MLRTIVLLEESDKRWLEKYSQSHNQSIANTIRVAVMEFRKNNYLDSLRNTVGLLKGSRNTISSIRKLRNEWNS